MHRSINIYIARSSMKKKKLVKGIGRDRKVRSDKICQDLQMLGAPKRRKGSSNRG